MKSFNEGLKDGIMIEVNFGQTLDMNIDSSQKQYTKVLIKRQPNIQKQQIKLKISFIFVFFPFILVLGVIMQLLPSLVNSIHVYVFFLYMCDLFYFMIY